MIVEKAVTVAVNERVVGVGVLAGAAADVVVTVVVVVDCKNYEMSSFSGVCPH